MIKASMQLSALHLKWMMRDLAKRRDSLRTYRIAATSGARGELLKIFSYGQLAAESLKTSRFSLLFQNF